MITYPFTFIKPSTTNYTIGQSAEGGTIAYILQPGDPGYEPLVQHGLVMANDYTVLPFYPNPQINPIGTSTAFGTGQANTNVWLTYNSSNAYIPGYANDYSYNGYTDWYVPSRDELVKFIPNKIILGIGSTQWWSSSNYDTNKAWYVDFINDIAKSDLNKDVPLGFFAVRSF